MKHMADMEAPAFRHLLTIEASLDRPLDSGDGPLGRRVLNAVAKGSFHGERLNGRINPGTGDWMLTVGEVRVVDARIVLLCDDDAVVHMSYGGRIWFDESVLPDLADQATRHRIDRSRYYFRTNPVFEAGHERYRWLNRVVSIGIGRLTEGGGVAYDVFEVL